MRLAARAARVHRAQNRWSPREYWASRIRRTSNECLQSSGRDKQSPVLACRLLRLIFSSEGRLPKSRLRRRKEKNVEKCHMRFQSQKTSGTSRSLMLVLHRPYAAITAVIFVSLPEGPTDVQVRIRSSGEHHHGARVPHYGRKTRRFSVKGPKNHPVRTDGNRGTRGVERVRVASLGGAVQHVDQARGGVRWLRLSGKKIFEPDHAHRINGHIRPPNNVLIAWDTNPIVRARAKHSHVSLAVHFRYCRFIRHRRGAGQHRSTDPLLLGPFGHTVSISGCMLLHSTANRRVTLSPPS